MRTTETAMATYWLENCCFFLFFFASVITLQWSQHSPAPTLQFPRHVCETQSSSPRNHAVIESCTRSVLVRELLTTLPSSSVSPFSMIGPVAQHTQKDINNDQISMYIPSCTQARGAPFLSGTSKAYKRVVTKRLSATVRISTRPLSMVVGRVHRAGHGTGHCNALQQRHSNRGPSISCLFTWFSRQRSFSHCTAYRWSSSCQKGSACSSQAGQGIRCC